MFSSIGPLEIGIVLVIALVVFGPKRIPELGNSLGRGIRNFGTGIKGEDDETAAIEQTTTADPEPAQASRQGRNP